MEFQGSKFLKVMAILAVIFGAMELISAFTLPSLIDSAKNMGIDTNSILTDNPTRTMIIGIIDGIIEIGAAIVCLCLYKKPDKVNFCISFAVGFTVWRIIMMLIDELTILNLLVPLLIFWAACVNKKKANEFIHNNEQ